MTYSCSASSTLSADKVCRALDTRCLGHRQAYDSSLPSPLRQTHESLELAALSVIFLPRFPSISHGYHRAMTVSEHPENQEAVTRERDHPSQCECFLGAAHSQFCTADWDWAKREREFRRNTGGTSRRQCADATFRRSGDECLGRCNLAGRYPRRGELGQSAEEGDHQRRNQFQVDGFCGHGNCDGFFDIADSSPSPATGCAFFCRYLRVAATR